MNLHELMLAIDNKEVDKSQSLLFELIKQYKSDPNVLNTIFNDNYLVVTIRAIFKRDLVNPIFIQFIDGFSLTHIEIYSLLLLTADRISVHCFDFLFDKYNMNYSTILDSNHEDKNYSFLIFLEQNNNFYSSLKKYGFFNDRFKSSSCFIDKLANLVVHFKNQHNDRSTFYTEYGRLFLRSYHKQFIQYAKEEQFQEYEKFLLLIGRLDKYILLNDTKKIVHESTHDIEKNQALYFQYYLEKLILNKQLNHGLELYKKENAKKFKI